MSRKIIKITIKKSSRKGEGVPFSIHKLRICKGFDLICDYESDGYERKESFEDRIRDEVMDIISDYISLDKDFLVEIQEEDEIKQDIAKEFGIKISDIEEIISINQILEGSDQTFPPFHASDYRRIEKFFYLLPLSETKSFIFSRLNSSGERLLGLIAQVEGGKADV